MDAAGPGKGAYGADLLASSGHWDRMLVFLRLAGDPCPSIGGGKRDLLVASRNPNE